jgi:hypothetical protein
MAAGEYRDFAEEAATGTNFTAVAFEKAASALQPLTRDYNLTNEQLKQLTRTTADLAAANGIGLVQSSNDVIGLMRGQTRAGQELGLNMKTNVIASMDGLTEAEKRAVAEGDTFAGAQARLHVLNLQAAGSLGMAAEAAGKTGDNFAKLDKATGSLWETLGKSQVIGSVTDALGTAATSAEHLIQVVDILNTKGAQFRFEYPELSGADFNQALLGGNLDAMLKARAAGGGGAGGFAGDEGFGPPPWVPTVLGGHVTNATYARSAAESYPDEGTRILNVTAATDSLTRAQEEAMKTGTDWRDETVRATNAQVALGDAVEQSRRALADLDQQMTRATAGESRLEALGRTLREDRARRARLGLAPLAGETDAIRGLGRAETAQQQAVGASALADTQALLAAIARGDDPFGLGKVQVGTQQVTADTVVINGPATGGQQSSVSGGAGRYGGARSTGPAYQGGLGRFGQ